MAKYQRVTMDAIKRHYYRENPHGHWFDPATMRFFHTRLPEFGFSGPAFGNDYYFVTSEQREYYTPRRYTIRKLDGRTGDISTIGNFHCWPSRAEPTRIAKALAAAQLGEGQDD